MNLNFTTLRAKVLLHIAGGPGTQLHSTPIVHPVRDWKIVLLGFSIAVLCFGLFAFLPYAGLLKSATEVASVPARVVRIDKEALSKMADSLRERNVVHEKVIMSGRTFIDPGR